MDLDRYAWLDIYAEPMFWMFPVATTLIGTAAFLAFALPWTLLAWLDPPRLRKYKIQQKPFEVGRYFWPCLARIFVNTCILFLLLVASWPLLRLGGIHLGELPSWPVIVLQLLFFIVLDDFLYYWMHRLMHTRFLLRHVHSVHHRLRNPFALAGNYFNWAELAMTSTLVLVGPLLVGAHLYVVWAWVVFRQYEAADGHTGYHLPWDPGHLLPVYNGAVYHDFHHARYQGNYAGFLPYLDRFWGTYARGYADHAAVARTPAPTVGGDAAPRDS